MDDLIEALVVGIFVTVLHNLLAKFYKGDPKILLFMVGFIAHFLFEIMGANRWYCKHGSACKRQ